MNNQAKEIFFSISNVNSLYNVIQRTFYQQYNIDIDNNYLEDLKHGMQYIFQTAKPSKNMNIREYITKLNKTTYDNIISYIEQQIKSNNRAVNPTNPTNNNNPNNIKKNNGDVLNQLQAVSVTNENNDSIMDKYSLLQKERGLETLNIDNQTNIEQNFNNTQIYTEKPKKKELDISINSTVEHFTPNNKTTNNTNNTNNTNTTNNTNNTNNQPIENKHVTQVRQLTDHDEYFNPSIDRYIPHINRNERSYLLTIDSFDRNRTEWPNTNNYRIHLGSNPDENGAHTERVYQNVKSIQLVHCVLANKEDLQDELYLLLHIDELGGIYEGTNLHSTKAFAKLNLYRSGYLNTGAISYTGFVDIYQTHLKKVFQPRLATLDKMTISFRRCDGSLFNFGADNPANQTYNMEVQNSLTFRIITEEADVTDIENENIN